MVAMLDDITKELNLLAKFNQHGGYVTSHARRQKTSSNMAVTDCLEMIYKLLFIIIIMAIAYARQTINP